LTVFGRLKSCGSEDHVSHAFTLRKTSQTRVGTGKIVKLLSSNDVTVFKILNFRTYWEREKLKVSQLETVGKIRGLDEFGRDTSDRVLKTRTVRTLKSLRTDAKRGRNLDVIRGDAKRSSSPEVIAYRREEQFQHLRLWRTEVKGVRILQLWQK
jgi:hypothetical protein